MQLKAKSLKEMQAEDRKAAQKPVEPPVKDEPVPETPESIEEMIDPIGPEDITPVKTKPAVKEEKKAESAEEKKESTQQSLEEPTPEEIETYIGQLQNQNTALQAEVLKKQAVNDALSDALGKEKLENNNMRGYLIRANEIIKNLREENERLAKALPPTRPTR